MNYLSEKKHKKNNTKFFIILLSFLILNIIVFPKPCINGSLKGLRLFITSVFPCLFPFLVLCNLIIAFNGINIYAKILGPILCKPLGLPTSCSIVLILSFLCGYPMGAKYTAELYEKNVIDFNTAEKLLNIASNASPLFIMGTISYTMLKNKHLGYILLISNYISCFIMGILLKDKSSTKKQNNNTYILNNKDVSFAKAFSTSVEDSINICTMVAGFVIIFSMLTSIIKSNSLFQTIFNINNFSSIFLSLLLGILEITNGCNNISLLYIPDSIKLCLISFLICFSGLCIILQVYSFLFKHNFSIKKYTIRKFIQGILSSLISLALYFISYSNLISSTVYNNCLKPKLNLSIYLFLSLILFLIPFIIEKFKKLFKIF